MRWIHDTLEKSHHLAGLVVVAAMLALGAMVGVAVVAGPGAVAHRLVNLRWEWLAVAFAAEVAAYVGYVVAYRAVACAESGAELRLPRAAALVATGFGVFVLAGGFVLDEEALRRSGLTAREARERVLGLGALEYVVLAPAAAVAAGMALVQDGVSLGLTLPWLVGVPAGLVLAWVGVRRRGAFAGGRGWRASVDHALSALALIARMARQPGRSWSAFAGIGLYWVGDIACLWAALHVFFAEMPPLTHLLLGYATGYALTRRTLPLGGSGVVEALLPFALAWVGIGLAPALLAVAAYRLVNLWLPIVPALAGLPTLRRLRRAGPARA